MCILKGGSNGREKMNQLHRVISNRDVNLIILTARRLLLLL